MGSIKDRNGMDLTEAEDIKRDGKNTQKNCTKKIFTTQIITTICMNLSILQEIVEDRRDWCAAVHGAKKSRI